MTFTHWFYSCINNAGLKRIPFEVARLIIRGGLLLASHFLLSEKTFRVVGEKIKIREKS